MSIREKLQDHGMGISVAAVLATVAVLVTAYLVFKTPASGSSVGEYFTTDDGATSFVYASSLTPPFDYNGKVAVIAHVAREDSGSAVKVIYLERFTPDAKAVADKIRSQAQASPNELQRLAIGHEYKAPGEVAWRAFQNPMELALWAHGLAEKQGCGKSGFIDPN